MPEGNENSLYNTSSEDAQDWMDRNEGPEATDAQILIDQANAANERISAYDALVELDRINGRLQRSTGATHDDVMGLIDEVDNSDAAPVTPNDEDHKEAFGVNW